MAPEIKALEGQKNEVMDKLEGLESRVDALTQDSGGSGGGTMNFDYKFWIPLALTVLLSVGSAMTFVYFLSTAYTDSRTEILQTQLNASEQASQQRFDAMMRESELRFEMILQQSEAHTDKTVQQLKHELELLRKED